MDYTLNFSNGHSFVVTIDFVIDEVLTDDCFVVREVSSWWITHLNGRRVSDNIAEAVREFLPESDVLNKILEL